MPSSPTMNHPLLVLWVSVFIISILSPSSVFADSENKQYTNCSSSFTCGVVSNVGFPFWGYNRADYCGLPDFQLDCENNVAKLIVNSVTYRILDFNFKQQTLTVARDDYWSTICPTQNKNNTIDGSSFNYASGLQYLALLYDCINTFNPSGLFETTACQSGTSTQNVYYGNESSSTNLGGVCDVVIIPIFETYSSKLFSNPTNLGDVIDDGFGLQWSDVDNDNCQKCVDKGGECGYSDSKFACYCKKGPCPDKSSSKRGIGIGVGVGAAAIIVILVGCFVCLFIMRRRKRNIPENLEESKDKFSSTTPTAASSKGDDGFTSTTNLSQSVPTYPSSSFESKSSSVHKSFYFGVQVFSYAELEEATKNFDPSMELGDGGFGTVYYGTLKDGRVVAVKRHYESSMKRVEQFMTEVEILARLRHHNLVTLYGCTSRHSRELLLVYEYIPNGTLADHLHNNNTTLLPWPVRLNIAVETASALAYLHKSDVIHRDVKTNNILLDHSFHVKVADFGLSRFYPKYVTHVSTAPQGTPGYVDPEYYRNYQLTDKSDVYSFGVVLVELISSLEAVDVKRHKNDINLANMAMTKIQNHELDDLVDPGIGFGSEHGVRRMVTAVAEVAFRCLQPDRDMRPSMNEVLELLRGIQSSEDYNNVDDDVMLENSHKIDEIILLKHVPDASYSPNSVTHKWVSTSTP